MYISILVPFHHLIRGSIKHTQNLIPQVCKALKMLLTVCLDPRHTGTPKTKAEKHQGLSSDLMRKKTRHQSRRDAAGSPDPCTRSHLMRLRCLCTVRQART
jgi:hypothetical protein